MCDYMAWFSQYNWATLANSTKSSLLLTSLCEELSISTSCLHWLLYILMHICNNLSEATFLANTDSSSVWSVRFYFNHKMVSPVSTIKSGSVSLWIIVPIDSELIGCWSKLYFTTDASFSKTKAKSCSVFTIKLVFKVTGFSKPWKHI